MRTKSDRDSRLQDAVIVALRNDGRVRAPDVGVEVHDGIVTLSGTVPTWAARSAAIESAHRVEGAHDIVDAIFVTQREHESPNDLEVARAVRRVLDAATPMLSPGICTSVCRGVVTLEGTLHSMRDRELVVTTASAAPGVRRVQDWLVVRVPERVEDALTAQIARALARHAEHTSKHVDFSVDGEVVKLTGTVRSESEREAVVGAVRGAAGPRLIDSRELHVVS